MSKVKVYFLKDVDRVAKQGDIKEVTAGHFRNFLLPRKLAVIATDAVLVAAKLQATKKEKEVAMEKKEIEKLSGRLAGVKLTFTEKANPQGHLFGSITAPMIAEHLARRGLAVEAKWIQLEHPIKNVGTKEVQIKLPNGVGANIGVEVLHT
ncbi:50S ribosomal protein L9 [Candidatus Uhrbacteria bacterium]|nr:50S ribosomal protein L9 [Candidatus Uhrbacteria bacterium]